MSAPQQTPPSDGRDAERLEQLVADVEQLRKDATAALRDLRDLSARQREVLHATMLAHATLAAIRASNTWRLLEWYRRWWVRLRGGRLRAQGLLALRRSRRGPRPVPRAVREAPLGVNVAGYISTESGMGEAVRASIRSLQAVDVPVTLYNVQSLLRKHDASYTQFTDDHPHPFNLVHLNADNMASFARLRGREYFRNRYTIGYWFWELSTFRDDWLNCFGYVDEVWVASEFSRICLQEKSRLPILNMPLPVVAPELPTYGRSHYGLPERGAVFLFTFDVSSQTERKNPAGVVRAFRKAGFGRDEAVLVLKFTNAEYNREAVRQLHDEASGLSVLMFDGYMNRTELFGLVNASDCYVSLHRAEGFGLTMAEAMRLGKPVIATAYSGNVDFMTQDNSYLVDHRIVPLTRDFGPYLRGSTWAEPDLDQAARFMRRIVEDPDEARRRGRRALEDIAATRDPAVTGARVRARLDAIQAGRVTAPASMALLRRTVPWTS
jgi:glycosyltransferase involved in cell wall biosynthesis